VQTLEGTPALVHGGPFANIAHGCNSVLATTTALGLADYTVTEAGFGADLGAEKFLDIKCRYAGIEPAAAVLVATVRALKMHGGVAKSALGAENVAAVKAGAANLRRHAQNLAKFGMPVVVALNHFTADTEAEVGAVREICAELGVPMHVCRHWAEGGKGAVGLAREVVSVVESGKAKYHRIYADDLPLADKIRTIATEIYGAGEVVLEASAAKLLAAWQAAGYGSLPVCMAKTQYSFSTDPTLLGAPSGHTVLVREVRLAAGAGFVVALCGEIMTMPGLPKRPIAIGVDVDDRGEIVGLS
jgi:formate--tetrahydrofolate ligase